MGLLRRSSRVRFENIVNTYRFKTIKRCVMIRFESWDGEVGCDLIACMVIGVNHATLFLVSMGKLL